MRTITIAVTAVIGLSLAPRTAAAQAVEVGVKGGLSAGMLPAVPRALGRDTFTAGARGGGIGGGMVALRLGDHVWFQPEVLFSAKGATVEESDSTESIDVRLQYVEVPALLRIDVPSRPLFATLGPVLAFNVGATSSVRDRGALTSADIRNQVRGRDVALALGGGVRVQHVRLEGRWTQGLTDVGEKGLFARAVKTRTFSVMAGVTF